MGTNEAQPPAWGLPSPYQRLYADDRLLAAWGLMVRIEQDPSASERTKQVFEAVSRYAIKDLPVGFSEQLYRFFCVTAGHGLWDSLDARNPHIADALLGYYPNEQAHLIDLRATAGRSTDTGVAKLLDQGLDLLWEGLPDKRGDDFPIDKQAVFPLEELRTTRKIRRDQAVKGPHPGRWKRWASEHPEQAAETLEQLRRGREILTAKRGR